ncbi:neurocalcin homolog isoform X2 [Babylonia areolata]
MGQLFPKQKLTGSQIRRLQRHVSFSESEIQEWYQEFCHSASPAQQDLYLSEDNFVKVYNSVYPGQSDEFARHIFRTFDRNGDHRVSFGEFLIGLSLSGSEDMQKRVSWAFQVYDVGQAGFITLDSMTQIIRAVFKMIGSRALRHTTDVTVTADLSLRHNDVPITPETLAEELFRQMDRDRDRRVTWAEFRQGVLRDPTALQLLQCCPPGCDPQAADDDVFPR